LAERSSRVSLERIQRAHAKLCKITHVSGDDDKVIHFGGGRYHCVLKQVVRAMMEKLRPAAESPSVHRQYVEGPGDLFNPGLDFRSFVCIAVSRKLHSSLQLAYRYRREMKIGIGYALEPREHSAMRASPPELRNDIGVQEIHRVQPSRIGSRRLNRPRAGVGMADRGLSAKRSSFRVGRADRCNRRQSSTGTSTAASAPRLVTT